MRMSTNRYKCPELSNGKYRGDMYVISQDCSGQGVRLIAWTRRFIACIGAEQRFMFHAQHLRALAHSYLVFVATIAAPKPLFSDCNLNN